MTRHLSEPSTEREVGQLIYRDDQLERRVGPVPAGLPMATMSNPLKTFTGHSSFSDTDLDNFYTNDPSVFQQSDGSESPSTEYLEILKPGVYQAFTQLLHVVNNGQIAVYLSPGSTGAFFGPAATYPGPQTTTNFMDADIWLGPFAPFGIDLLAFSENDDFPFGFTVKTKWTNLSAFPAPQTFDSPVVLVIVQLSPINMFG